MPVKARPGREFEVAVSAFLQKLDPSAEVLFDHHVCDPDTGTYRQCDAWINTSIGGHIPLTIYVSCKDSANKKNKLDIGDICTFKADIDSVRASTGIIYSSVGFTQPALAKAKALNVSCCRLYRNEPADIPQSLMFEHFSSDPVVKLVVEGTYQGSKNLTWNDLFDMTLEDKQPQNVLDAIAEAFTEGEKNSV